MSPVVENGVAVCHSKVKHVTGVSITKLGFNINLTKVASQQTTPFFTTG
ncbi:MAG: hypothetical protein Q7R65_00720 [bacterium]|nr:hypothetical protein [bacterium]